MKTDRGRQFLLVLLWLRSDEYLLLMNYRAKYDGNDAVYAIYRIFKMINDKMDIKWDQI